MAAHGFCTGSGIHSVAAASTWCRSFLERQAHSTECRNKFDMIGESIKTRMKSPFEHLGSMNKEGAAYS